MTKNDKQFTSSLPPFFYGGQNICQEILRRLQQERIPFQHFIHEPTPTSQDSARIRNMKMEEGIKALVLRGKTTRENFQFNLPAHLKLDMKRIQEIVGERCDFESPAVILERFGLFTGGIPPFGHLFHLKIFFDTELKKLDQVAFNCGLLTESIEMKWPDLIRLVTPIFASFFKS